MKEQSTNKEVALDIETILANTRRHAPTSVALFDINMRYLSASPTWGREFGLNTSNDLIGKSHYNVFPGQPSHWRKRYQECLSGTAYTGRDEHITGVDGRCAWITMNIVPWNKLDHSIGGIIIYTNVVTEKRKSEDNLKKMVENLKRSNTELERFAHICSHDLKEPLRSVSGFVQLLLTHNSGTFDDTSIKYIQHVLKGLDRMDSLIRDILLYSRVSTQSDTHCVIDIKTILTDIKDDLMFRLQEAGAQIHIGDMPHVIGDVTQIRQLLTNLIENAIKFRSAQPLIINVTARDLGSLWKINVKDNGIGIEEEYQHSVFDMFKRLNSKNRYEGSGVGLAICKKIVNVHGGNIFVRSTPNVGSEFIFTLPKMKSE